MDLFCNISEWRQEGSAAMNLKTGEGSKKVKITPSVPGR